ncbi:complexin-4-like [Rhinichthys klamathensis goyatoka]|uniref:complexin-4-like n=1 Tax=Rhinichthys klamathensis goyatoka TaxID=3034132 RepID=UPI0024B6139E|nr:complexin-4-like [Rhinichthys klamathensis goyatoka]
MCVNVINGVLTVCVLVLADLSLSPSVCPVCELLNRLVYNTHTEHDPSAHTHTHTHTHTDSGDIDLIMESAVKKSLLAPIKTLKFCVTGEKQPSGWTTSGSKGQRSKVRACADTHLLRPYQADLERERKRREAMSAQRNAERAAMRLHFRSKYQLTKNAEDRERVRVAGGKVCLPRDLAKMVRPDTDDGDDSFSVIRAFQRLRSSTHTHTPAHAEPCRVM